MDKKTVKPGTYGLTRLVLHIDESGKGTLRALIADEPHVGEKLIIPIDGAAVVTE